MKKRISALLLSLGILCSLLVLPASATSETEAVRAVQALGIMTGDQYGDMALDREVTRAEFAKLLVAASSYKDSVTPEGAGYSLYKDVKSGYWASEYIRICAQQGWMIGYTDGTFGPLNTITLEEACTAALRPLGYDSNALEGTFPYAQLNKAASVGLRDDLARIMGEKMTRRDCAILFYNLLTAKTSGGQVYASTLGYTVTNGTVDYSAIVLTDLEGPFVAQTRESVPFTPLTVYRDGNVTYNWGLSAGEVYYYNKNVRTVWIYTDRVTGLLTALTPSASSPTTLTVGGKSYTIATSDLAYALSALNGGVAEGPVTLLLGMDGKVAEVRTLSGPYTVGGSSTLPFTPSKVYRNGALASSAALSQYDIYYYDQTLSTVWIYTDRVSGKITSLSPNSADPVTVTISGTSYTIGTDAVANQLSALGEDAVGSYVTLLLGMEGQVAGVLTGDSVDDTYYGMLESMTKDGGDGDKAAARTVLTVLCSDGEKRSFTLDGTTSISTGSLVKVTVSGRGVSVSRLSQTSLSGKVNADATRLGNQALAANVHVLDTSSEGDAVSVDASRLAGITLHESDVRFYTLDKDGAIDNLILNDVTGDTWTYGLVTSASSQSSGMNLSSTYTWYIDGAQSTRSFNGTVYAVKGGGFAIRYNTDGSIKSMKQLSSMRLTALGTRTASSAEGEFVLADAVQVYLKRNTEYYPTTLSAINAEDYTLAGWYDDFSGSLGGQIRVIVATEANK